MQIKEAKTHYVRRRPKLSRRRNSGKLPGVIYMSENLIGCRVKVVPINIWRGLIKTFMQKHKQLIRIRKVAQ